MFFMEFFAPEYQKLPSQLQGHVLLASTQTIVRRLQLISTLCLCPLRKPLDIGTQQAKHESCFDIRASLLQLKNIA